MLREFKSFIARENLVRPEQKTLLAVSGGVDSMVMTELFYRSGFKFGIVHCNFQLRGIEADEDERLVKRTADSLGVPFYSKSFDTKNYASNNNISIQMAARDLRYGYFEEVRKKHDYKSVATAHHLDDQIETFFINLLRGTGISGLHGINVKSDTIIRPLLFAGRKEIENYCRKKKIEYREDASNQSVAYMRNKIRLKLLPVLAEINEDYRQVFNTNFNHIRSIEKVYQDRVEKVRKMLIAEDEKGTCRISIDNLFHLNPLNTLLYEVLSPYNFKLSIVEQLIESLDDIPGKQFYSDSHRIIKDRDELIISPLHYPEEGEYLIGPAKESIDEPIHLKMSVEPYNENFVLPIVSEIACLDYELLKFPLRLRKWKKGDAFRPLGMHGKKKLSDYFTDNKFSINQKENAWLLLSGDKIVWVVGHRLDERFKITAATRRVYVVQFIK
ncbi:MAG: tRNA lysidine(34) synthetase TilS [Bacteroidales bacterium]|nr:tRNA lysidine(34) synthetase TilS [Bacteroidales bacterium]